MKKIGIILLMLMVVFKLSAMEQVKETNNNKTTAVSDTNNNTKVIIGDDLLQIENSKDALKVKAGDRGINILESLEGGRKVSFNNIPFKKDDENDDDKDEQRAKRRQRFSGHWAGLEVGFNNITTSNNSMTMPADINFMSMHSGKSVNFNFNFSQLSLGISRHVGFVTGLGINFNNYRFDGNFNIQKLDDGRIDSLSRWKHLKSQNWQLFILPCQYFLKSRYLQITTGFMLPPDQLVP